MCLEGGTRVGFPDTKLSQLDANPFKKGQIAPRSLAVEVHLRNAINWEPVRSLIGEKQPRPWGGV